MASEHITLNEWKGYSEKNELYKKLGYKVYCRTEQRTRTYTDIEWEPSPLGVGCGEDISPPEYVEKEETYEVEYYYVEVPNHIYNNQIDSKNKELKRLNNKIDSKNKELKNLYIKEKEVLQTNKIKEYVYQIKTTKNIIKKLILYCKLLSFIEKKFEYYVKNYANVR